MPSDPAPPVRQFTGLDLEDDEAVLLSAVLRRAAEADAPEVSGLVQRCHDRLGSQTNIFPSRSVRSVEGTDEEPQAIIDWLGSLEPQR